jgi:putative membrane protein (TIGR04086 family)
MTYKLVNILKTLIASYVITGVMLLLLAFCLYKFNLSNWQITAGIIVTYALSTFIGGYVLAKKEHTRRLLWGMSFGVIYFAVLMVCSLIITKGVSLEQTAALRSVIICIGAGAIGAFATPVEK